MDGLKQRIIGALVLVSLAVIFVPMIFDEPHSERTSTPIQIPEEPPFPEVNAPSEEIPEPPVYEIEESGAPETASPAEPTQDSVATGEEQSAAYRMIEDEESASQPAPEDNSDSSTASAGTEPKPDDTADSQAGEPENAEYTRSLEGAWVVQLGSFGNPDNARRLRDQVREKGYGSHLQELTRGDAVLTRVFSGPFASKSEAEAAKRVLDDAFNLNSLVTEGEK
ncbi:MAG: SPOR domain-containing protein [Marinobacter sp.]|nr:SPOR domain-containing protein [Marinobacter sp.]